MAADTLHTPPTAHRPRTRDTGHLAARPHPRLRPPRPVTRRRRRAPARVDHGAHRPQRDGQKHPAAGDRRAGHGHRRDPALRQAPRRTHRAATRLHRQLRHHRQDTHRQLSLRGCRRPGPRAPTPTGSGACSRPTATSCHARSRWWACRRSPARPWIACPTANASAS